MTTRNLRAAALAVACAAMGISAAGCTGNATADPAPQVVSTGRLVLTWTIDGATDPNACAQAGATQLDIRVAYSDGTSAGEYQADCAAFGATLDLPEGSYSAAAELRDANGSPRTTTIDIEPFDIVSGSDLNIPLDFPNNSFL